MPCKLGLTISRMGKVGYAHVVGIVLSFTALFSDADSAYYVRSWWALPRRYQNLNR